MSLMILKARYHLSHECINDILRLFHECLVDAPTSYKSMKNLLCKQSDFNCPQPHIQYICSSCGLASTSAITCPSCSASMTTNGSPTCFFNFDLTTRIERVVSFSPNLRLAEINRRIPTHLVDIEDGECYQQLLITEQGNEFITLTLNVDGVSPHRASDLSIWPIFLVINEIEKSKRFALENVLVGGVWPGPTKPSREEMYLLFTGIVEQLKALEKGKMFTIRSPDGSTEDKFLKVSVFFSKNSLRFVFLGVSH